MVERQRRKLSASEWVVRQGAAGYLVKMCCPTAKVVGTLGPPGPRPPEALEACDVVTEVLRKNRDPYVLNGVLNEHWYPACVEDIPVEALLGLLAEAPPPNQRSEIVWQLDDYAPSEAIVDALLEELRREPGHVAFPLHDTVVSVLSDLGEQHLDRVIETMRMDASVSARHGAAKALSRAATDPIALPTLEPALEEATASGDKVIADLARQGLAALRESSTGDPVAIAEAMVARADRDPGAIIRLGTRRISCRAESAPSKLEAIARSADDYWNRHRAKLALISRTKMCGAPLP
ncbi:MAG: hypothetical protein ACKV2T_24720 [Kofleriaceae bacterium]